MDRASTLPENRIEAHWRSAPRLVATIVSSLASLGSSCAPVTPLRLPYASIADAMRSDWLRIGADFKVVVRRGNADIRPAA
jgi:hypothetical protein